MKRFIRDITYDSGKLRSLYVIIAKLKARLLFRLVSDKKYLEMKHIENTGVPLNIDNPKTFDEKLAWIKLYYYNDLMTKCADKILVREYLLSLGLGNILIPSLGVYDEPGLIDFDYFLGDEVFIKCNHSSGGNILYKAENHQPTNKIISLLKRELRQNYYKYGREKCYKDIPPRIIVERVLRNDDGSLPNDYKFFCFMGDPKLLFYYENTCLENGMHTPRKFRKCGIYDRQGKNVNMQGNFTKISGDLDLPNAILSEMVDISKKLSAPFPFCRVDLYFIKNSIYFGEITFFPGGGNNHFEPTDWMNVMGDWIRLNEIPERFIIKE